MLIYGFEHGGGGMPHSLHGVFIGDIEREHDRCVIVAYIMKAEGKTTFGAKINPIIGNTIRGERENIGAVGGWAKGRKGRGKEGRERKGAKAGE